MDVGSHKGDDGSWFPGKGKETAGRIIIKEELTGQLGKLCWRAPGVELPSPHHPLSPNSHVPWEGENYVKTEGTGNSLAVQWLRLRASTAGARVRSLVRELRFRELHGAAKKKKKKKAKELSPRTLLKFQLAADTPLIPFGELERPGHLAGYFTGRISEKRLNLCFSQGRPQTSSVSITWELIRHAH